MNSEQIILTDRDSVSGQLVAGPVSDPPGGIDAYLAWGVLGVSVVLGVIVGVSQGANPTDQWAAVLAWLPGCLLVTDVVLIGWMLLKRVGLRALVLPVSAGVFHILICLWAQHLASFDVFYALNMQNEYLGQYDVRFGIVILLVVLNVLALVGAVYPLGVAAELAGDLSIPVAGDVVVEDDVALDGEHIYEAQVLLNNLGYDIAGIDGILGPKTQTALKQFQAVIGLAPDGLVTAHTMRALRQRDAQSAGFSFFQTVVTFLHYGKQRLVDFLQVKWFLVRNR